MGAQQSTVPAPEAKPAPPKDATKVAETILNGPGNPTIVGSYVYKKKIRGGDVDDVDVICDDVYKAAVALCRAGANIDNRWYIDPKYSMITIVTK
jgi:hypothetical protein